MSEKTTETLALVGVILGGLSVLSTIVLFVLFFSMRKTVSRLVKTLSESLQEDGKLKHKALPNEVLQEVSQASLKAQEAERKAKHSDDHLLELKKELQALLERVSRCENDMSARNVNHFEFVDGSSTKTRDAPRTPGAQPLQRFVGHQNVSEKSTRPAHGPSPGSPRSSSSVDSDPMNPGNGFPRSTAADSEEMGISYSARPSQAAVQQDDVTVKADIGFGESSSGYQPAELDHQHQTLWSTPSAKNNFRIVPLLTVQKVQGGEGSASDAAALFDGQPPTLAPLPATPTLANMNVDNLKNSPGYSAASSSPGNTSNRNKRGTYGSYGNHGGPPLSARGINPEKHPELHAKELAEMKRLVQLHCSDSATVVNRTIVKCMWCHQNFACPPYRPQSFFFKDIQNSGEHDGHFWACVANPNNSLQAGRGVNVGDGKVLI